jgi:hypothetical protein
MKPTPQISPNQFSSLRDNRTLRDHRNFPLTDYSFQSTIEARTSSPAVTSEKRLRAFRKLSSEFFGAETSRHYRAELSAFTVITAISIWPIISSIVAVVRMVRNY